MVQSRALACAVWLAVERLQPPAALVGLDVARRIPFRERGPRLAELYYAYVVCLSAATHTVNPPPTCPPPQAGDGDRATALR